MPAKILKFRTNVTPTAGILSTAQRAFSVQSAQPARKTKNVHPVAQATFRDALGTRVLLVMHLANTPTKTTVTVSGARKAKSLPVTAIAAGHALA